MIIFKEFKLKIPALAINLFQTNANNANPNLIEE